MMKHLAVLFTCALLVYGCSRSAGEVASPPPQMPSTAPPAAPAEADQIKVLPRLSVEMQKNDRKEPEADQMIAVFVDGKEMSWSSSRGAMANRGAQVRLVVKPDPDFQFICWKQLPPSIGMKNPPRRLGREEGGMRLDTDISYVAEHTGVYPVALFNYNPDAAQVDLVADYRAFLKELQLAATPEEADTFDRGGMEYLQDNTTKCVGNGVPDIAEFALLNAILKSGWIDFSHTEGVVDSVVWKQYRKDLEIAAKTLPMAPPAVQRAVVAYEMSGNFNTRVWLTQAIKKQYGIVIWDVPFDRHADKWLVMDDHADADQDGRRNIEEWHAAVEKAGPGAPLDKVLSLFVDLALDPAR